MSNLCKEYNRVNSKIKNLILDIIKIKDVAIYNISDLYKIIYQCKYKLKEYEDNDIVESFKYKLLINSSVENLFFQLISFIQKNSLYSRNKHILKMIDIINIYINISSKYLLSIKSIFCYYEYYFDKLLLSLIEHQKNIYKNIHKYFLNNICNYHYKKDIFLIDYLYMLGNNDKECVDIFIEQSHKIISSYANTKGDRDDLSMLALLNNVFFPCNYYYNKCPLFFNSLRLHNSNYRIYSKYFIIDTKEKIIKDFLQKIDDKIKFFEDFVDYIIENKEVNHKENIFCKLYLDPIRDFHEKNYFFDVDEYLSIVLKQYNKSIFINENKFLLKKIIYKLNNIFFSSDL
jgi:hypothetical protein